MNAKFWFVFCSSFFSSAGSTVFCADAVTYWNSLALAAIRVERTSPPEASRNLAILHIAIFDACNGVGQDYEPYSAAGKPPGVTSKSAAISAAAHYALTTLFPALHSIFDSAYQSMLEATEEGPARRFGIEWGRASADAILRRRSNDGAGLIVAYIPSSLKGSWAPTPPLYAPALLPNWSIVVPFAMPTTLPFRTPRPPALSSAAWTAAYNEVKALGRSDSVVRTNEQTAIARFWADGAGTVTPPGHWNVIARDVAEQRRMTLEQNARLFALLNIAEADAAILAWDCKYLYNFWRPITAIRNAETDGNPATEADPTWTPLLVTPPFPECISGHSTFSGAAAAVLAEFFGSDSIGFTTTSEDLPDASRTFSSFSAAASEAGMSRIYGGIHFSFSNTTALEAGTNIGRYVVQNFLQPNPGRRQRGQ
jgi:membrane-associated phospholipid phosphatase